jgi:hypothetical protein
MEIEDRIKALEEIIDRILIQLEEIMKVSGRAYLITGDKTINISDEGKGKDK